MFYKNVSTVPKTFQGVRFNPGEVKEVSGYINDKFFVRVSSLPKDPIPKEPPKRVASAKKAENNTNQTKEENVKNG